ncbi:hypothetical protein [Prevotella sp.]|uniref:hypothetical protein n=1 Tax=Prevotella sp. TaxID=59823 RepID=UPI002ABE7060|nr:hypothetical protein [Prevotella sp.]
MPFLFGAYLKIVSQSLSILGCTFSFSLISLSEKSPSAPRFFSEFTIRQSSLSSLMDI